MSYINSLKETHINTCNNTCINISINKNNTINECTECKHPCNIEKKEGCVCKFNILTLIDIPKEVTYSKEENEKFLCLNCKIYNILNCSICGYLFNIKSITHAYNDHEFKQESNVCLQCYIYEACGICGYLGGSTPCIGCRFI